MQEAFTASVEEKSDDLEEGTVWSILFINSKTAALPHVEKYSI